MLVETVLLLVCQLVQLQIKYLILINWGRKLAMPLHTVAKSGVTI